MRKLLLFFVGTVIFTAPLMAEKVYQHDYIRPDGSGTRVTTTRNSDGTYTTRGKDMSKIDYQNEQNAGILKALIGGLFLLLVGK
jgi:hypothetical protein